ncbi:MAG TPA: hypothetical protein PKM48_15110, partial [Parvularculaceae bacterium]|nr:hypothetical protein [Parvularculaceae bacterium]
MGHIDEGLVINDPSSCVLFLGSGFSAEATNVQGTRPPIGKALAKEMLAALDPHTDESAYDDHDLKDIATYVKKGGVNIYDLLRDQFTISKISEAQETILGFDWRRIYTTNYDDAVEFFRNS